MSRSRLKWRLLTKKRASSTQGIPAGREHLAWVTNTVTLIHGERDAVLVDTFLSAQQSKELADWVVECGKNLTTIYFTHAHGDHFFGLKLLLERFPQAKAVASAAVVAAIQDQIKPDFMRTFWEPRFPSGGVCPPLPACVADLATSCTASGKCVESSTQPTDPTMPSTDAQCYSNGVKVVTIASFDLSTGAVSLSSTVSKNGSTCFSFSSTDGATLAIKDGSGNTVATITNDASGNEVISCGGKTYTAPADCMSLMMPGAHPTNAGTTCTMGTCAP